jgi:hypothetical protein
MGLPYDRQQSSLMVWPEAGVTPTLAEEAGFLREVLSEMPALGFDPHKMSHMILHMVERGVVARVVAAAVHSDKWRAHPGSNLAELLNSSGAYQELNAAFEPYGLEIAASGAEEIAIGALRT